MRKLAALFLPIIVFLLTACPSPSISIPAQNLPPQFINITNWSVQEGDSLSINLLEYVSDENRNTLSFQLLNNSVGRIVGSTYIYNPDLNAAGSYQVSIKVIDEKGHYDICQFTITVTDNNTNHDPEKPSNPIPANNSTGIGISVDLTWSCSDPDNDTITYDIYFGVDNIPSVKATTTTNNSYIPGDLANNKTYYWFIIAKDGRGGEISSDIWSFTTVNGINQPPVKPDSLTPEDLSINRSLNTILLWDCSDPDGDILSYDVYLGTSSNLTSPIYTCLTKSYNPGTLEYNTKYYWKVVAKDGKGGVISSDTISFTTESQPNQPPATPSNLSPANGAVNRAINSILSWNCSDPDNDVLTYDIYFDTSTGFSNPISCSAKSYDPGTLEYSTKYYWKVIAKDGRGGETSSDTMSFTTEDEPTPEQVDLIGPIYSGDKLLVSNESIVGTTTQSPGTLEWISSTTDTSIEELDLDAYRIDYVIPLNEGIDRSDLAAVYSPQSYSVGDPKLFWVSSYLDNSKSQLEATLQYIGSYCEIWVENPLEITTLKASQLGSEFDSQIWGLVTQNFSLPSDVDTNGKVTILCFDIQDGFAGSGGYVAGYFGANDLFVDKTSNQMEIFYIDTYPLMHNPSYLPVDVSRAYSTLVHEFQHMVSFNRNYLIEDDLWLDVWLDEGLSMAAEHMYEGVQQSRIDYFNSSDSIKNGHSLLNWEYNGDVLSNYSLSYLFAQYIKEQCGQGDSIYKEIIEDTYHDYRAVETVIHKYINPDLDFGSFMTNFRLALLLKNDTGYYGFKGNANFDSLSPQTAISSNNLYGGGAFYKTITTSFEDPGDSGSDIKYAGVTTH